MKIHVRSKRPFINPWTKNSVIGDEPAPVPFDNLCRALLRDGSIERVAGKKPRQAPLRIVPKSDESK